MFDFRNMVDDPQKRLTSGIDGVLAGYTMLKPKEGWAAIRERSLARVGHRAPLVECSPDRGVVEPIEHQRTVEIDLAFCRDLRHPAPRRAEPALSHTSIV